jgi:3-phenylpropionate/cinnamic acid dioxygenase small subunit
VTNVSPKLRLEIEDLYARYAALLDEGPLDQWPSLYFESGSYRAVTAENVKRGWALALILCESRAAIEDRVYAIANLSMRIRHVISGFIVEPERDAWKVSANFAMFETVEGQQTVCFAAGRYHDVVARDTNGSLRFREKLSICDGALIRNSLVYPL